MFFDSVSNQISNQTNNVNQEQLFNPNNNTALTLSFGGSSGGSDFSRTSKDTADFGRFSPTNDNTNTTKASNDIGASVGLGIGGGSGSGGTVAMKRKEDSIPSKTFTPNTANPKGAFDGYQVTAKSFFENKNNLIAVGVVVLIGGAIAFMKKKRK